MNTILLDPVVWDFVLDASANIAMASDPYSLAQDAASAIRLFIGEAYYDTTQGIPYWTQILGKRPPLALMKAQFTRAALTVPGVVAVRVFISGITDRKVSGQVQITNSAGVVAAAGF